MLLLEYGGSDRSIYIQMPSALSIPMNMPKYNWRYHTKPSRISADGACTPRAARCSAAPRRSTDWSTCAAMPSTMSAGKPEGASGWGYRQVLPYFRRAERRADGGDEYRGGVGKLHTRYGLLDQPAAPGVARCRATGGLSAERRHQRLSAGRIRPHGHDGGRRAPLQRRQRLSAPGDAPPISRCAPTRSLPASLFEGRRAVGVRYRRGERGSCAQARREVILSGGPINSPQLLKLSGIGPGAELRSHGIGVVQELSGVGENLQDHLEFYFQVACMQPITLYSQMTPYRKALIGLRWLLRKDGLGATNHFETGGFIRSRAGERYPDIQYHFLPMAVSYDGSSLAHEHGFQAHVGPMRSQPRLGAPGVGRSAREAQGVLQLHGTAGRLGGDARLRAPDARDLRAARVRPLSGPGDPAGRRGAEATSRSTNSSASRWRAPITRPARARWGARRSAWRWWIPKRA